MRIAVVDRRNYAGGNGCYLGFGDYLAHYVWCVAARKPQRCLRTSPASNSRKSAYVLTMDRLFLTVRSRSQWGGSRTR